MHIFRITYLLAHTYFSVRFEEMNILPGSLLDTLSLVLQLFPARLKRLTDMLSKKYMVFLGER